MIPSLVAWPTERTSIEDLFPDIVGFALSAGGEDTLFYSNDVEASSPWQHAVNGNLAVPSPASLSGTAFPGVTLCQ